MTDHTFLIRQNQALRAQIDTLREYARQLEDIIAPKVTLPRHWRIEGSEEKLLNAIRASGSNYLHRERAMTALFGMADDVPDDRILDVLLVNIRRKLRAAGCPLVIECKAKFGWRLSPESCAIFDTALACDQARWPRLVTASANSIRGISHHA